MIVRDAIWRDATFEALCGRIAGDAGQGDKGKEDLRPAIMAPRLAVHGLWGSSAPILAGLLAERVGRPLLYLTAHLEQADDARDDIETVLGRAAELLPAWETAPGEGAGAGEITAERARLCGMLRECGMRNGEEVGSRKSEVGSWKAERGTRKSEVETRNTEVESAETGPYRAVVIVAPVQALMQPAPTVERLDACSVALRVGDAGDPQRLAAWLHDRGFQRLDQVEQPGDYAVRGGILDVFATADKDPIRVEFFGDRIESVRQFELGAQRSVRELTETRITVPPEPGRARPVPAENTTGGGCAPDQTTTFVSYLPADTLVVLHEPAEIAEIGRVILDRLGNPVGHYSVEAVLRHLDGFAQLHVGRFPAASAPDADTFALRCEPLPTFEPKASDAVAQLLDLARNEPVVVYCDNEGERSRLGELIEQAGDAAAAANVQTVIGLIHRGFRWLGAEQADGPRITVVPHHELFRRYTQRRRLHKVAATRPIESFLDLNEGDYVVHLAHGIARFVGMRTMRKGDTRKSEEFLTLRFADEAVVHVPVSQIDLVQKYIGVGTARPALSKLGGTRWKTTRERVEEAVGDLAAELLRIQAIRESQPGVAYPNDTHWQAEFESAFLYPETPDQTTAIADIKTDMGRSRPMDRLLCGDVGYGKTELAMRAAFKAVEFGKQVAVLVPTTVLAEQHYRTFRERMADYPFAIERLNRLRSTKEQRDVIAATRRGHVDVLIGTHRLLSKDVEFADLGLAIVDEEQRFGVEHKERLKRLRATVEVLTLTATPIPRTLHMSMIGLRDISSLATPPLDRRAISTRVTAWSDELIREAVVRELNRDGQVYFVHNRVRSIHRVAARLAGLVPEARFVVGHGQMPGDELEDVMLRFVRHDADVLVCTTIIEAGLDIPNANTIFIDRAEWFGLADLHQLRGRVGRYKHRAYCYLLLSPDRPITNAAARRLKAVEQYSDLGAGFQIAMRDLEIRGAGNILGPEQSGNIAAVGYELYCQTLEKTVRRMKGEPQVERVAVHLELDVEAHIPRSYIPSDRQRIECYRRLAACRTPPDVEQLGRDLSDVYGRYPETVDTLLTLAEIKVRAASWRILSIQRHEPDVIFTVDGPIKALEPLFTGATGAIGFPDGRTLYWRLPDSYFHGQTLLTVLGNLFRRADGTVAESAPERRRPDASRRPAAV